MIFSFKNVVNFKMLENFTETFTSKIIKVIGNFNTYYQHELKEVDKEKDKFFRWSARK
jgi:hypothetical protein